MLSFSLALSPTVNSRSTASLFIITPLKFKSPLMFYTLAFKNFLNQTCNLIDARLTNTIPLAFLFIYLFFVNTFLSEIIAKMSAF